ncbi:MAG: OsmC family protein [Bacteroidetes bacterium]|nr:OsmC family protein [Bacteroidota bacterium]
MSTSKITQPSSAQIKEAVFSVINTINQDSDKAFATFSARSELSEGLLASINIREFSQLSDEPQSLGGTNLGPNPVEIVLGALGACQEIVVKAYASVLGIEIQKVSVEAHGNLDLRGFFNQSDERPGFTSVEFKTTIVTLETDQEKLAQLHYFTENRCPVLDIIQNAVPSKGVIEFVTPKEQLVLN